MSANNTDQSTSYTLLDGIDRTNKKYYLRVNERITPRYLTKYSFKGKPLYELNMSDLLKKEYRKEILEWYTTEDEDEDDFLHPYTIITMLLLARIEQLDDDNAFIILSELSKDVDFRYMGLDYYISSFTRLFFLKYEYLIKTSLNTDNYTIMDILLSTDTALGSLFYGLSNTEKRFSEEPIYDTYFLSYGQILFRQDELSPLANYNNDYLHAIRSEKNSYSIDMIYARDNETINYYDVYTPLRKELKEKLTPAQYEKFTKKIKPMFDVMEIKNYHVSDSDGYVNMRSSATVNSSIVTQIPNGTYVYYLGEETRNWVKVLFKKPLDPPTTIGYIYKDRLKSVE